MQCFVGECPEGFVVDHVDGDRSNNKLSNLRYISNQENITPTKSFIKKNDKRGKIRKIKCTAIKDIEKIEFASQSACARHFKVSQIAIHYAIKGNYKIKGFTIVETPTQTTTPRKKYSYTEFNYFTRSSLF